MSQLRSFGGFTVSREVDGAYRCFVDALGRSDPGLAIDRAICAVASVDRFYVYEQQPDFQTTPAIIAARYEPWLGDRVHRWGERFRFDDPIRHAFAVACCPGAMTILRVEPDDIAESDYRVPFFDEAGIVERISIVQRHEDRWMVLHAARRRVTGIFAERELDALAGLSQLLLPLALRQRDWPASPPPSADSAELERRFARRFPAMTPRETQVCARAVLGMSTEATALDLGIGRASVHTYRRRAYARLGIGSPYELARLVLN
jgi:DNA-binding CsgD family transcriptional regulator